jgi:hypothetical protein
MTGKKIILGVIALACAFMVGSWIAVAVAVAVALLWQVVERHGKAGNSTPPRVINQQAEHASRRAPKPGKHADPYDYLYRTDGES